jgi:hypothetical protein
MRWLGFEMRQQRDDDDDDDRSGETIQQVVVVDLLFFTFQLFGSFLFLFFLAAKS